MLRVVLTVIAAVTAAGTAGAAPFVNGSFEFGPDPGAYLTLQNGSSAITGWTVTTGNIDYVGTYWVPEDGERSVDLNGSGTQQGPAQPGGIAQTFDTMIGVPYTVSFWLAGNTDGAPDTKAMTAAATGGPSTSYTFDIAGHSRSDMGWVQHQYNFTASAASTTLEFRSTVSGPFGPALDNVSVAPANAVVPEPATLVLLGAGLVLISFVSRRLIKLS